MIQGQPEEHNPPFITVVSGSRRHLVASTIWDNVNEEYKIDQIFEPHNDLDKAKEAAVRIGKQRGMEVR